MFPCQLSKSYIHSQYPAISTLISYNKISYFEILYGINIEATIILKVEMWFLLIFKVCCSVTQSCPTLWPHRLQQSRLPCFFTISQSLLKLMSIELVMPSNHLILCHPLLLLPSIFPSIRVFPMSQFFPSGGENTGVSASASVLPMNIQGSFPSGNTHMLFST